jgi:hypothetical protein
MTQLETLFTVLWETLCADYCPNIPIIFKRDNRLYGLAETQFFKDETHPIEVRYNWKTCCHFDWSLLVSALLHEIGHIRAIKCYSSLPKNQTTEQEIMDEVVAERYALAIMKVDWPKEYEIECRHMRNALKRGNRGSVAWDKIHREAYKRIKDYQ